jgi:NAD(P)-dependent dehydrogenase (short-subunit alcohol dehydrogenase family)
MEIAMDVFKEKIAIVTGGASGMGRAVCEELCRRGATVVVADINEEGAGQVASAINQTGGQAGAARVDVAREEEVRKLIDETVSEHGRLDYMFNNAGICVVGEERDVSLDHWRSVLDVNLFGVIYGTTAAYSVMVKQGFGHIVNTASLAGLIPATQEISYTASKYAVVGISNALRVEGADLGVRVSVVCPGFVRTGIFDAIVAVNVDKEKLVASVPFKMMESKKAAQEILRGVARNRAIIVFPFHARIIWWLYRLHPSVLIPLGRRVIKDFRAFRYNT